MAELVNLTSTAPAKMFGLDRKGPGGTRIRRRPRRVRSVVDAGDIRGESPYGRGLHPFESWTCHGAPAMVYSRGDLVYGGGDVRSAPGRGRFVRRSTGPFPPETSLGYDRTRCPTDQSELLG